jgi:uncharacterized protein (TIGR02646 family)
LILIQKGCEPGSFTEYRKSVNASYEGLPIDIKDELRKSILSEQGELCAYCMCRITTDDMQIEHYLTQKKNPQEELIYSNLLGVCKGNEGHPNKMQTCDRHRGDQPLTADPRNGLTFSTISYSVHGEIKSSDPQIHHDLKQILNLNANHLVSNRRHALDALTRSLQNKKGKGSWAPLANKYRERLLKITKKDEYIGILLWYLEKKISA